MNSIFLKVMVGVLAIFIAGAVWLGIGGLLKVSHVNSMQFLAVILSHLSIIGWGFYGVLVVIIYKLLVRNLVSPMEE